MRAFSTLSIVWQPQQVGPGRHACSAVRSPQTQAGTSHAACVGSSNTEFESLWAVLRPQTAQIQAPMLHICGYGVCDLPRPAHSGRCKRRIVSALGFSSTMQIWRSDPETPRLISPSSSSSAAPTCLAPTALRAANKLSKDGLSTKSTDRSEGRDDVDERDVVYHDHVSAFLPTPSTLTNESLVRLLFPLH